MPLSEQQIRADATAYAAVHGRSTATKAKKGKAQKYKLARPIRGARAGFTDTHGGKADVWSHKDLAR